MENLEQSCINYLLALSKFIIAKCNEIDAERALVMSFTSESAIDNIVENITDMKSMISAMEDRVEIMESLIRIDAKATLMNELVESTAEFHHALSLHFKE